MNLDYDIIRYQVDQMKDSGLTEEMIQGVSTWNFDRLLEETIEMRIPRDVLFSLVLMLHEIYNQDGRTFISDDKYDILYEMNKRLNGLDLTGDVKVAGRKIRHKYPQLRGTVGKCHFILNEDKPILNGKFDPRRSYEQFVHSVESQLGGYDIANVPIRISLKVDGVSGVMELKDGVAERVLKRGETVNDEEAYGQEIAILKNRTFGGTKDYGECGLKVEVFMRRDDFSEYVAKHGDYDTPRSAITSIVNRDDFTEEHLKYVSIYDIEFWINGKSMLPNNDTFVINLDSATDYKGIKQAVQRLEYAAKSEGIPADGAVIRIMQPDIISSLGRDDSINNFEVAYKFPMEKYNAVLKDVNFTMGLGGSMTPVAEIEPININGVTITNVSLGSIPRLLELDLRKGQNVLVTHDVIPYLYDDETDKHLFLDRIEIPVVCPRCESALNYSKSRLYCDNVDCDGVVAGNILRYIRKMGIEDISYATVDKLMEHGLVSDIPDLYKLTATSLSIIPGFGPKTIKNILEQIDNNRNVTLDTFLGSLGIPNVGQRVFKKILLNVSNKELLDMFAMAQFDGLSSIKGIGSSTVGSLNVWASTDRNYSNMMKLLGDHIQIKESIKTTDSHTILFTRVRDSDFQEFLEGAGYGVVDSYSKNVDVVIYGGESSKTKKAMKDGKVLLTLQQAHEVYNYNVN